MKPFPNDIFSIDDDELVKLHLLELGISDQLFKRPKLPGKMANSFLTWAYHETHWLLFCRFSGHKIQKENGLLLIGWPKAQWTAESFAGEVADFTKGVMPEAGVRVVDIDESRS